MESCFLWLIKTIFSLAKELYGLSPGGIMDPILLSSHFRQKFQMACPNFNTLHKFILFPEPSTSNTPLPANQFLFFITHLLPFLPLSGIPRACQNDCSLSAFSESLFHPSCPFLSSPSSHLQSLLLQVMTTSLGWVSSMDATVIYRISVETWVHVRWLSQLSACNRYTMTSIQTLRAL